VHSKIFVSPYTFKHSSSFLDQNTVKSYIFLVIFQAMMLYGKYHLICQSNVSIYMGNRNQGKTILMSDFDSFLDKLFHIFKICKLSFAYDYVSYIFGCQDTRELKGMKSDHEVTRKILNLLYRTLSNLWSLRKAH
jgi:hypothetical protein